MSTFLKSLALLASCFCFTGCIEGPSTDARSPEVSGWVLDFANQQPLSGVRISLHEHSSIATRSDSSGHFVLRGTKNIHLFTVLGICSTSFPQGKYYGDTLDIVNAGYNPLQVDARKYLPPDATNAASSHLTLRDIFLPPLSK